MATNSVLINIGAKTKDAVGEMNKLDRSMKDVDGSGSKLNRSLKTVAKVGFAAVAAAAGVAVVAFVDFAKEAINDYQAAQKLQTQLGKLGFTQKQIDANAAWISTMELATTVVDDQIRVAVGRFAAQTGDLAEAQRQAALAADLATGANISYEKAVRAVATANTGSFESLEKYTELIDFNKDGVIDLDESMRSLEKAYKGASEAAADRDPWQRILILWGNLKEALGQFVLPLLKKLGDWFKDPQNRQKLQDYIDKIGSLSYALGEEAVKAIQDFLTWIGSPAGKKYMQDFKKAVSDIATALISMNKWMDENRGTMKLLWGVLRASVAPFATVYAAVIKVRDALVSVYEWLGRIMDRLADSRLGRLVGLGSAAGYSTGPTTYAGPTPTRRATGGTVVININGALDPQSTARQVKRLLETYDVSQGRSRGAPLAMAW